MIMCSQHKELVLTANSSCNMSVKPLLKALLSRNTTNATVALKASEHTYTKYKFLLGQEDLQYNFGLDSIISACTESRNVTTRCRGHDTYVPLHVMPWGPDVGAVWWQQRSTAAGCQTHPGQHWNTITIVIMIAMQNWLLIIAFG